MPATPDADLARLLEATKEAHAGVPDDGHFWADWYADHLVTRIGPYLSGDVDRDTLAGWLAEAEQVHQRQAPDTPWPEFYAGFLLRIAGNGDE